MIISEYMSGQRRWPQSRRYVHSIKVWRFNQAMDQCLWCCIDWQLSAQWLQCWTWSVLIIRIIATMFLNNMYWLLTLTLFNSMALLPSSDRSSCAAGMADFNRRLVRPRRLQQEVCFFLHWNHGDIKRIVFSLVCCTACVVLKLIMFNSYLADLCRTSGLELWYFGELYMGDLHRDT